jgi:hypothetical protein
MKKILLSLIMGIIIILPTTVFALGDSDITVKIISPTRIESTPAHDDIIKISVKNNTTNEIKNLGCYLTIVDVGRSQTYPVDEFGEEAYQTRNISLMPGEKTEVSIPVKILYIGNFKFTASVINFDTNYIYSAEALNVVMKSNSNMNKQLVMSFAGSVDQ